MPKRPLSQLLNVFDRQLVLGGQLPFQIGCGSHVLNEVGQQGGSATLNPSGSGGDVFETDHVLLIDTQSRMSYQPDIQQGIPGRVFRAASLAILFENPETLDAPQCVIAKFLSVCTEPAHMPTPPGAYQAVR